MQIQLSIGSVFLNPGYFATFAEDAWSTCDLVRSKASWSPKGFTTPPKKIPPHNPMSYGTVAAPQGCRWGCVSCSWPDFSTWASLGWFMIGSVFGDGRFSKENPGAGGNGVGCFLCSACSSDWSWCSLHPALKGSFYSRNIFMKSC